MDPVNDVTQYDTGAGTVRRHDGSVLCRGTRIVGDPPPKAGDPARVLIVRRGYLGDIIMGLPVLAALPKHWDITFVGPMPQSEIVYPLVNRSYDIDDPQIPAGLEFDLALNLLYDPDGSIGHGIHESGIKTVVTAPFIVGPNIHVGSMLLGALGPLGITRFDRTPFLPTAAGSRTRTIAFHPASSRSVKNWPIDRWITVIKGLADIADVLLICGPQDHAMTQYFIDACPCPVLQGVSLRELAYRLAQCAMFIGHDTGVTHLAAAVGTPTLALFGGTNPQVWGPMGKHVRFLTASTKDNINTNFMTLTPMDRITVDLVLKESKAYYHQIVTPKTI